MLFFVLDQMRRKRTIIFHFQTNHNLFEIGRNSGARMQFSTKKSVRYRLICELETVYLNNL